MFLVENNNITMTKGDSGFFTVKLTNGDGSEYIVAAGDKITFTVKKKKESFCRVVLEKRGEVIVLEKQDTEKIPSGEYVYDVYIKNGKDERQTVIEGKYILRKAVHEFD